MPSITRLPRAVIFDWDNTLVNSLGAIGAAINHTRQHFGLETWTQEQIVARCTRSARDIFSDWFGKEWEKACDIYYQTFDRVRHSRPIDPKPGAYELLCWLNTRSIPSVIVSNKRGDYLRHEVERLEWQTLFAAVAGAQDAPRDKPAREHVDYALAQAGLKADASVWFIGDSETDILCAHNAGCTPVLIGSCADAERLSAALNFPDCAGVMGMLKEAES